MYKLDLDGNGAPLFTKKNFDIIDCILRYDSNYRAVTDESYPEYKKHYAYILKNGTNPQLPKDRDTLKKVIASINKIDSTHLYVGKAFEKILDYIDSIPSPSLSVKIKMSDNSIVDNIANASKINGGKRFNISFASKFCAYVSRIVFGLDNYCIYDNVVQSVLPYYHYLYSGSANGCVYYRKDNKNNNRSTVAESVCRYGYAWYRKVVDETLLGIKNAFNVDLTYAKFDHLVWYYFKGSEELRQRLLNTLP